jgi:hypothetical protein
LQLLLIIDWISHWARDVHREAVLQSLGAITTLGRAATPAETEFTMQVDDTQPASTSQVLSQASISTSLPHEQQGTSWAPIEILDLDNFEPASARADMIGPLPAIPSQAGALTTDQSGSDTMPLTIVAGTDFIRVRRRHFALPETALELRRLFWGRSDGEIHDCFNLMANRPDIPRLSRYAFETQWRGQAAQPSDSHGEVPLSLVVLSRIAFDESSSRLILVYTAVTCTQLAREALAELCAATQTDTLSLAHRDAHDCPCLTVPLGRLPNNSQDLGLLYERHSCLGLDAEFQGPPHYRWMPQENVVNNGSLFVLLDSIAAVNEHRLEGIRSLTRTDYRDWHNVISARAMLSDDSMPGIYLKRTVNGSQLWSYLTLSTLPYMTLEQEMSLVRDAGGVFAWGGTNNEDFQTLDEARALWLSLQSDPDAM